MTIFTRILTLAVLITPVFAANDKNYTYLALGDSVAFGLDPRLVPISPGQPLPTPDQFTGYPEVFAGDQHLLNSKMEVNASCPGETSASFFIPGALDNGCHFPGPQGQPPFKSIGLHVNYTGTQLDFAVSQLQSNKHIDLVTLGIGANDLLIVLAGCATSPDFQSCIAAGIPPALTAFGQNLAVILTAIRQNYSGTLVLVEYYSTSPQLNALAQQLNGVMVQVGSLFDAKFADGYTAFQAVTGGPLGDPCAAGLLIHLTNTVCDIDPSPFGQAVLAKTLEAAVGANH